MSVQHREYNSIYASERLNHVAFPLGGIGSGMICIDGTGAFSHLSIRNKPDVFNEPRIFSAIKIKGDGGVARVLEGPFPRWKVFGRPSSGRGCRSSTFGLPRFSSASFEARFPFGTGSLQDPKVPLGVEIVGWSPFVPGDADNSGLPAAGVEYRFTNPSDRIVEAVYTFAATNFMATGSGGERVLSAPGGFVLWQPALDARPWEEGAFCASVEDEDARVDCAWFRGSWYDPLVMAWKDIQEGTCSARPPIDEGKPSAGASIHVPLRIAPGQEKTIKLMFSWYVPETDIRRGRDPGTSPGCAGEGCCDNRRPDTETCLPTHKPWYSYRFSSIEEVASYWRENYESLREKSAQFRDCFYDTTLPPEIVEAVAANLTILKSPTVLRQTDGRLWCWEGCCDDRGCCAGSCTHVWNYAQALPHLFPALERTLRETEFNESQDENGHQNFRSSLPIRPAAHDDLAASDGQLGGIMKVHRDWRISGDTKWLRTLWPKVQASLDYCIEAWDPGHKGVLEEPHHNTYDIEFWGPDGMCSSFYLGALKAATLMGQALDEEVSLYVRLLERGQQYLEEELHNGEYFYQKTHWQGLRASDPIEFESLVDNQYSPEAIALVRKEGPKYQYGTGCLSDGVIGAWMAMVCGIEEFLDRDKVRSHLRSVHRHNLKRDLSEHVNLERPGFALGDDGGLLICTWPKGGRPSLPLRSDEVWTGIEYQVASHLMSLGMVEEGLDIVRTCRDRHDGRVRNPFNEYECGHWYARAMASYALIQGLTGVRYDAVEKTLYISPSVKGDFRSFLCTATGYGTVGLRDGEYFIETRQGHIDVERVVHSPNE